MPAGPFFSVAGLFEILGLLLLGSSAFVTSYPFACRLLRTSPLSLRLSATALVAYFEAVAVFHSLAALGLFRREIALPLWVVFALLCYVFLWRRNALGQVLRRDVDRLGLLVGKLRRSWLALVVALVVFLVLVNLVRGFAAPTLGWDGLTYHLYKAGRWVQTGAWISEAAPDAWTYYRYFPPGGDIVWAWLMLPGHTSSYIAVGGLLNWLVLLLASYTLARLLDADRRTALLGALAFAVLPCVFGYLMAPYVNNLMLAFLLLAFCFLHRFLYEGDHREGLFASAGLALAFTVQTSALPFVGIGGLVILGGIWRRKLPLRESFLFLFFAGLSLLVAMPGPLRAWLDTGSPLYPLTLAVGGHEIFGGNEQLAVLFAAQHLPPLLQPTFSWGDFFHTLFLPRDNFFFPEHLNFGPTSIILVALGVGGAWRSLKGGPHRGTVFLLLLVAIVVVLGLMPSTMLGHRTVFAGQVGRLLAPGLAAFAIIGVRISGTWPNALRIVVILGGVYFAIPPTGFGSSEFAATLSVGIFLIPAVALLVAISIIGRRLRQPYLGLAGGIALAVIMLGSVLGPIRSRYRYDIYESAARPEATDRSFHLHPLWQDFAGAWPVWKYCDSARRKRIAFAAGWDHTGHNWFRFPLLGSRLQNEVFYVSPIRSGGIMSYAKEKDLRANWDTVGWVRRLVERQIDTVVVAPPLTIEQFWMRRNPEVFTLASESTDKKSQAFRLNNGNAKRWLARTARAIRGGRPLPSPPQTLMK